MKFHLSLAVAAALVVNMAWAPQVQANDQLIANICQYVHDDNKSRLRKKLKESNVKVRNIYDGIRCNGETMIRSAMTNNANDVGVFLVKRLSAKSLQQPEFDGQTVLDWASANGHEGSEIVGAIRERIGG
ncbi:DUF3718 domain-containing protein [Ferrimonas sediminicola]|uniref:DUF3718 domain-containing protein n=1 Tax=Ferrimonas sediminicola TaxID=2569538 RepID=A0A4V5NXE2_9GAMM|nr:DUF3718 domain-containing protein [Ferrimonas sediminicola]TKB48069.1 DUF3718 domain-containing protein [Ferrimonas sediminicola]